MGLVDVLVVAVATHQAVNVFRYSSLFARWRQWRDLGFPGRWLPDRIRSFLYGLLGCPWCVSIHVAFWLTVAYLAWRPLRVVVVALAASQLAGWAHDRWGHRGYGGRAKLSG